jgi:hypothetical protein
VIDPIYEYSHNRTAASVTGGYVYRGKAVPALRGWYVFADYSTGRVYGLKYENGKVTESGVLIEPGTPVATAASARRRRRASASTPTARCTCATRTGRFTESSRRADGAQINSGSMGCGAPRRALGGNHAAGLYAPERSPQPQ